MRISRNTTNLLSISVDKETMRNLIRIASLLLVVACSAGASDDDQKVYVGDVVHISRTGMGLDQGYSTTSIGFFGEPEVIANLEKVKVGDKVRVVFGSGIPPGEQRSINKLLEIRTCQKIDLACDADQKAGEAKEAIAQKARDASEKEHAECRSSMQATLLGDPRYVPSPAVDPPNSNELLRQINSFKDARAVCSQRITDDHQRAVYDACRIHHCGDNIGGGCAHIAGYALSDAAIERAVLMCKDK